MGINMTPDCYFEAFVEGNYEDFKEHPYCVRRAFNAAVAASSLADHYFNYNKLNDPSKVKKYTKIGSYIEHIEQNTHGDFRDIKSIANAYKHLYTGIDPHKAKYSSVSSTGAVEAVQLENEEVQEVSQNNSNDIVVYTRKTGDEREFLPALESVIDYWQKELSQAHP